MASRGDAERASERHNHLDTDTSRRQPTDPPRPAESSAKLDVLLPRVEELVDQGHKALIFSQFTNCKDSAFFMAGDRINDLATEKISGAPKPDAVLGWRARQRRRAFGGAEVVHHERKQDKEVPAGEEQQDE